MTTSSKSKKQKDNILIVEQGYLITFKDKSCSFIRTKKMDNESGYFSWNDAIKQKDGLKK